MDTILNIDPARFAAILKSFYDISTKNPEDYDLGNLNGEDDYADCPEMFNYPDFS